MRQQCLKNWPKIQKITNNSIEIGVSASFTNLGSKPPKEQTYSF